LTDTLTLLIVHSHGLRDIETITATEISHCALIALYKGMLCLPTFNLYKW